MLKPCDIYVAIRQQITKWICKQPTTLSLQENYDYRIDVSPLPASSKQEGYRVIVHCLRCLAKTRLFQRGSAFMLSNWTRHIHSCITKNHKAIYNDGFTQKPLLLSPRSTCTSSQNDMPSMRSWLILYMHLYDLWFLCAYNYWLHHLLCV